MRDKELAVRNAPERRRCHRLLARGFPMLLGCLAITLGCSERATRPPTPPSDHGGSPARRMQEKAAPAPAFLSWPPRQALEEFTFFTGDRAAFNCVLDRFASASRVSLGREGDEASIEQAVSAHVAADEPEYVSVQQPGWLSADEVIVDVVLGRAGERALYWFVVRREAGRWAVHTKYKRALIGTGPPMYPSKGKREN